MASQPRPAPSPRVHSRSGRLIGAGATLLAISLFLPWVQVILVGNVTFIQLANLSHHESLAWGGLGLSAGLAVWGFSAPRAGALLRTAAIVVAIYVGWNAIDFIRVVNTAGGLANAEIGAYLAIGSGILLLVGAVASDERPAPAPRGSPGVPRPTNPPPGWYADPHVPSQMRWWDGATWTGATAAPPPATPEPSGPPPPRPDST